MVDTSETLIYYTDLYRANAKHSLQVMVKGTMRQERWIGADKVKRSKNIVISRIVARVNPYRARDIATSRTETHRTETTDGEESNGPCKTVHTAVFVNVLEYSFWHNAIDKIYNWYVKKRMRMPCRMEFEWSVGELIGMHSLVAIIWLLVGVFFVPQLIAAW
jgi:hypothetical protein